MASIIAGGRARRAAKTGATTDKDVFLDVVVFIFVLLFMILATGVGILALQISLR